MGEEPPATISSCRLQPPAPVRLAVGCVRVRRAAAREARASSALARCALVARSTALGRAARCSSLRAARAAHCTALTCLLLADLPPATGKADAGALAPSVDDTTSPTKKAKVSMSMAGSSDDQSTAGSGGKGNVQLGLIHNDWTVCGPHQQVYAINLDANTYTHFLTFQEFHLKIGINPSADIYMHGVQVYTFQLFCACQIRFTASNSYCLSNSSTQASTFALTRTSKPMRSRSSFKKNWRAAKLHLRSSPL